MLAIGRALMSSPKLLLLDEPSIGLSPLMSQTIATIISTINREGVSILLVEQNAKLALKIAHKGYVLETGRTRDIRPGSGQCNWTLNLKKGLCGTGQGLNVNRYYNFHHISLMSW